MPLGAVGALAAEEERRGCARRAWSSSSASFPYAALGAVPGAQGSEVLAGWEPWTRAVAALLLEVVAARGPPGAAAAGVLKVADGRTRGRRRD